MFVFDPPSARPAQRSPKARQAIDRLIAGKASYLAAHDFNAVDRIEAVRAGVPASLLTTLADDMAVPKDRLYAWLGIARATANRKLRAADLLNQDESERALGLARLLGQVERIVAESGEVQNFNAAQWTARWLASPNASLGGQAPGDYLDTADGRALVSALIAQMQSGAYA
jgi:putative toxin-antitoxin system antitoxin component (TIGR02293 family)